MFKQKFECINLQDCFTTGIKKNLLITNMGVVSSSKVVVPFLDVCQKILLSLKFLFSKPDMVAKV